jgi:hypothetical protein
MEHMGTNKVKSYILLRDMWKVYILLYVGDICIIVSCNFSHVYCVKVVQTTI